MPPRRTWTFSPHTGGTRIPAALQEETRRRILAHAEAHYAGRYRRIDVRFRGTFCYIDAYLDELRAEIPVHLCRLRYFGGRQLWSVAFYTYSHERYEPTVFQTGQPFGTPEEGLDIGAIYLE